MSDRRIIYTIGHSNRSIEEFIALLEDHRIELLADVRTIPRSAYNPQFNKETLPESLGAYHINYVHIPSLGGLRGKRMAEASSQNMAWEHASFRNYADYANTETFRAGLDELVLLAKKSKTCYMCAEAVWWRCHRRIITDYLLARGWNVQHIMGAGKTQDAEINEAAIIHPDGNITYPGSQGILEL